MHLGRGRHSALTSVLILILCSLSFAVRAEEDESETGHDHSQQNPFESSLANGQVTERQVNFYMTIPAFSGLVGTIAQLNNAMRVAAENPMDEWRRDDVRTAVSKLPGAITELAQVFLQSQLHDKDLPPIQAMLGGFVDVNAADRYKKFLQKPDASLIPNAGPGFPIDLKAPPPTITSASIALSDPKFQQGGSTPSQGPVGSSEVVDLSMVDPQGNGAAGSVRFNDAAEEGTSGTAASPGAAGRGLASLGSTDAAAADKKLGFIGQMVSRILGTESSTDEKGDAGKAAGAGEAPTGSNFLTDAAKDIALLESAGFDGGGEESECDPNEIDPENPEKKCKKEDGVFKLGEDKKKKEGPERHQHGLGLRAQSDAAKADFRLDVKPKNWRAIAGALSLLPAREAEARSSLSDVRPEDLSERQVDELSDFCERCLSEGNDSGTCRQACDLAIEGQRAQGRGANGNRGGGGGNAASGGGGGGGGGRGAGAGSTLQAVGSIVGSAAGAAASAATAAIKAGADKHAAAEKAREVTTIAAIQAETILAQSKDQMAVKEKELEIAAALARQKEAKKTEDTELAVYVGSMVSAMERDERRAARAAAEETTQKEIALLQYVQAGQNQLRRYAMLAQAVIAGTTPNSVGGGGGGTLVASATPASTVGGLAGQGSALGVAPSKFSPFADRLLRAVSGTRPALYADPNQGDNTILAGLDSGAERVRAIIHGSSPGNFLRVPNEPSVAPVRAIASVPDALPHRLGESLRGGASARPSHSR